MYLEARKYVSKFDYTEDERTVTSDFSTVASFAPAGLTKYSDFAGGGVTVPVGYWRKANAVHGWFVTECQDGVDDCRTAYVPREKLVELRDACKSVLDCPAEFDQETMAVAMNLLPQSGFFFGSTKMDEWYFDDLKRTVEMIDNILSLISEDTWEWSFYYHSSW